MNCDLSKEAILNYFDRGLALTQERLLRHHLSVCITCREEFISFEAVDTTQDRVPAIEPPDDFEEVIMKRIFMFRVLRIL